VNGPGIKLPVPYRNQPSIVEGRKVFRLTLRFSTDWDYPQPPLIVSTPGLAIGRTTKSFSAAAPGKGSVIIDERNGDLVRSLDNLNGNDEVWYNQ
jgi:hypothetical protein